jgi:hypothetical protein
VHALICAVILMARPWEGDAAMPDTLNDFATREPSSAQSGRFRLTRLFVTTNLVLAGLLSALSFAGVAEVTGISAYLGTFLLIGALVPPNLLRFERYASGRRTRALAKLRKSLGVSAGVWFVAHSVVSVWELFDLSLPGTGNGCTAWCGSPSR